MCRPLSPEQHETVLLQGISLTWCSLSPQMREGALIVRTRQRVLNESLRVPVTEWETSRVSTRVLWTWHFRHCQQAHKNSREYFAMLTFGETKFLRNMAGCVHRCDEDVCTEKLRMCVWGIWGCVHGGTEDVCMGNVRMCVWGIWGCVYGECEDVCIGNLRRCAWCMWGRVHRCNEDVCTEKLRLCVWGIWGCVYGECEDVCTEKLRMCVWGIWGCVYGESEDVCV
jgi:hypothetical protein